MSQNFKWFIFMSTCPHVHVCVVCARWQWPEGSDESPGTGVTGL